MNKKILVLLLSLFSTTAMAGGNFVGPYAGVSLGYVDGQDDGKEYDTGVFDDYTQSTDPSGGLLGIFAGYNWALDNNMLIGVEADYDFRNADDTEFQKDAGVTDTDYPVMTDLKAAASLRARLGYLFNDKTMGYITAGYAAAKVKRTFNDITVPAAQSSTKWQDGWTAGIGVEHVVMDRMSLRAEYRYADYGDKTVSTDPLFGPDYTEEQNYDEQSIRVGISYQF